jgi:hypothetical protein
MNNNVDVVAPDRHRMSSNSGHLQIFCKKGDLKQPSRMIMS